ncbi:MAG: hypothetical protein FJX75_12060 [Armatimonadetes bacterium]|nr:hypothetical protein [Armatimonadota bacterium]
MAPTPEQAILAATETASARRRGPSAAPQAVPAPSGPWGTASAPASAPDDARSEALRRAREAIRAAIIEETAERVLFDEDALRRAYALLVAAQPELEENSVCGKLSVGFPINGEDYEDAPNED